MFRGKIAENVRKLFDTDDYFFIFFAPGRVNLIGEHIDYNGGAVMPFAINYGIYLAIRENNLGYNRFYSENLSQSGPVTLPTNYYSPVQIESWINYPLGVIKEFADKGNKLNSYDFYYSGNIPIASGLSSSAAIEMVTAVALNHLLKCDYTTTDLVNISRSCENNFIGVNCGIMDQFIVGYGKQDHVIKLDCASLNFSYHKFDTSKFDLVLINTNKPRKLVDSKYNERFSECNNILKIFNLSRKSDKLNYLCELDYNKLDEYKKTLKIDRLYRRLRHVLSENKRVNDAVTALINNDFSTLGKLLSDSHNSLRYDYEVTGIELDTIVDILKGKEGLLGARMTGAGFGGCVIALFKKDTDKTEILEQLKNEYYNKIGYDLSYYFIKIADGAKKI